jgi:hypothetical protein
MSAVGASANTAGCRSSGGSRNGACWSSRQSNGCGSRGGVSLDGYVSAEDEDRQAVELVNPPCLVIILAESDVVAGGGTKVSSHRANSHITWQSVPLVLQS